MPRLGRRLVAALSGRRIQHGPIGIDFTDEKVHLVQMARTGESISLLAAASCPYPPASDREGLLGDGDLLRRFLGPVLKARRFRGHRAVVSMPSTAVRIMLLEYRLNSGEDEDRIVLQNTLERVGGTPEQWTVDYLPIRGPSRDTPERTALVAVAERGRVLALLDALGKAGLQVEALEIGPQAIRRLVSTRSVERGEMEGILVVNIGYSATYLTVVSGRRLILDREVPIGESRVVERVTKALGMAAPMARELLLSHGLAADPTDRTMVADDRELRETLGEISRPIFKELAAEVGKALVYTASKLHGASPDRTYLQGGVARWPGAADYLGRVLALPVEVFNPIASFDPGGDSAPMTDLEPIAGIAIATGCALRGVVSDG